MNEEAVDSMPRRFIAFRAARDTPECLLLRHARLLR
jgi:hypothetical protein